MLHAGGVAGAVAFVCLSVRIHRHNHASTNDNDNDDDDDYEWMDTHTPRAHSRAGE